MGKKVLIVEDDKSVGKMLCFSLRRAGFDVIQASTGPEALRLLEVGSIDAVVLDLGFPDDGGGDFLRKLRQAVQSTGRPVRLVISAMERQEVARRYDLAGSGFLAKPFDPWVLIRILGKMLYGNTTSDRAPAKGQDTADGPQDNGKSKGALAQGLS